MRKLLIALLLIAGVTLAAGLNVQAAPEPTATQELLWDADTEGSDIYNVKSGVWFVMPFDGTVITVRTDHSTVNYDDGYNVILCPRGADGLPDEASTYGSLHYPGGASGPGWVDFDVSSLNVELNEDDEFYYVIEPDNGFEFWNDISGSPEHNAWNQGAGWSTSGLPPYHLRVVVEDDSGSRVELSSWGEVKTLD
ncbi:MAG: hypothetical protein GF403_06730 [Candidatus Coatesbacteria bacterium]|nr:hypothetical protein [Candidatus Coatesbacteria bacterium]